MSTAPLESFPQVVHDVYPGISPEKLTGINKGRVALIIGASKGLGLASAKAFAQSGASVFLTARNPATLEPIAAELESSFGVPVGYGAVDVTDDNSVKAAVEAVVTKFGKIDIVIANAGGGEIPGSISDTSPSEWWSAIEVNLKGSYSVTHYVLPELIKTKGHIVYLASLVGQLRFPGASRYNISKHALNRLAEFVTLENPDVHAYAIHPGAVGVTDLGARFVSAVPGMDKVFIDTPELSAWTEVRLTSGSENWLSGRYFDSNWSLDEIQKYKEDIIAQDALKNRLALPVNNQSA